MPRKGRRSAAIASLVTLLLLLLTGAVPLGSAHPVSRIVTGPFTARPMPARAPFAREQQTAGIGYFYVASIGGIALSSLVTLSLATKLVRYDAPTNTTSTVATIPGGANASVTSIEAAGGNFYVSYLNFSANTTDFVEVSPSGTVTTILLPSIASAGGAFVGGNRTALWAASPGRLVEIDPKSNAVRATYRAGLPRHLDATRVFGSGRSLYIAGSLLTANGSTEAFLGDLNLTTRSLSTLYRTPHAPPPDYFDILASVTEVNGTVYAGGYEEYYHLNASNASFTIYTVAPLLYRFDPGTGHLQNVAAQVPIARAGIAGVLPWGSGVLVVADRFVQNSTTLTFTDSGGLFVGHGRSHGALVNLTAVVPAAFDFSVFDSTSASGEWAFLANYNSASGNAEIVAVHR